MTITRVGTNAKYREGWDRAFGKIAKSASSKSTSAKSSTAKSTKKSAKARKK